MGIKSTRYVSRENTIERIMEIDYLLFKKRYREIEETTSEYDYSVEEFVNSRTSLTENGGTLDLTQWTDEMLENKLDQPFYRYSMFDNYSIEYEGD